MTDFLQATSVVGGDGQYTALVDDGWCVWTPAGGYLMAIALRAAGERSAFEAPLSMSCHFLSVPRCEEVQLVVTSLRRTRIAESLRVSVFQGDRPVLETLVWCGEPVEGYEHADANMPEVPEVGALAEEGPLEGKPGFQSMWSKLEHRPCVPWHWHLQEPTVPRRQDWVRLRDHEPGQDAFVDAARVGLLLDLFTWPAAARAHVGDSRFVSPTLSFAIDFHQRSKAEWLLSEAYSPLAHDGLIAVHDRVWSPEGKLVASANGTMLCRPRPPPGA